MSQPSEPRERPIIFRPDLAQAVYEGRKTQTRRVIKPQPLDLDDPWPTPESHVTFSDLLEHPDYYASVGYCKYGRPGDFLWVKESYFVEYLGIKPDKRDSRILYRGAYDQLPDPAYAWRNPRFTPRWASRSLAEIISIQPEPVQAITEADALAEAVWTASLPLSASIKNHVAAFRLTWDDIHPEEFGWLANPWVWKITFKTVKPAYD